MQTENNDNDNDYNYNAPTKYSDTILFGNLVVYTPFLQAL